MPRNRKKKGSQLTKTPKTNIMKGVGRYTKSGKRVTQRLRGRGGIFEDIGKKVGPWLGNKADGFFNKLLGLGSYQVSKNSLIAQATDPPILSNTKGATRVQHREYITDVIGSTAFNLTAYPINPGVSGTFPWLSTVANCFEEYILHGIVFEFKSTSATALNSTNTALGTVIMATEYNALHANFVAKRDMENYVYSTSCSPDMSALHPVECARDVNVLNELYVRNVPPALPTDLRFSDLGRFQIATVGMQASANIGELWVTYDIELIKPKLPDAFTALAPGHLTYDSVLYPGGGVPTYSNFYGTTGTIPTVLGSGLSPFSSLSGNTMSIPQNGRYMMFLRIGLSTGATQPVIAVAYANGASAAALFQNNSSRTDQWYSPNAGLTSTTTASVFCAFDVLNNSVNTPTVTWSFGAGWSGATITSYDLIIVPLPQGFASRPITLDNLRDISDALESIRRLKLTIGDDDQKDFAMVPAIRDYPTSRPPTPKPLSTRWL